MMPAMIGSDPQTGTLRWTMDRLYSRDCLPLVPLTLGVFALPELCDLLVARTAVVQGEKVEDNWRGLWRGCVDCFTHLSAESSYLDGWFFFPDLDGPDWAHADSPNLYCRLHLDRGREPWKSVAPIAIFSVVLIHVVFDWLLAIPWPDSTSVTAGRVGSPRCPTA
jgi:hypothetical protein